MYMWLNHCVYACDYYSFYFFILTFVGSAWSICFFIPITTAQWPLTAKDFYTRSYPLHYFLILILEKEPVFPFQCLVLNKGTTGTIFITSLVWRGPWLGIEPGTSRTRCQHSTTRLSRRRYWWIMSQTQYTHSATPPFRWFFTQQVASKLKLLFKLNVIVFVYCHRWDYINPFTQCILNH